jgi:CRISPR-associated endonuclease/helicase Cas3
MSRGLIKFERLIEMERLYYQRAYTDIEIAERLGIDRTTAYRDRMTLEAEIPFVKDDEGRWRIDRTKYLSEIRLNLHEALALYLAARKASQQTHFAQRNTATALEKLAMALRQPMTEKLVGAAERILSQSEIPERDAVMRTLAEAWVQTQKLRIEYLSLSSKTPRTHVVSPYLIEPSPWTDGVYLIGLHELYGDVVPYRVDRILKAVNTGEGFMIPEDFDEVALLRHAWGIWSGSQEPEEVVLRFAPGTASRRLRESIWHPLEKVELQPDGGCLWRAPIAEWQEMLPWIRGWGADVEVLAPAELRENLKREVEQLIAVYRIENKIENDLIAHWRARDEQAQLLLTHLTEASSLAERFAAKIGLPEAGKILGLLHDFGKASDLYQKYLRSAEGLISSDEDEYVDYVAKRGKIDHSTAGAQLVYQILSSRGREGKFLAQILALAIASHHSGLIDCLTPDGKNNFQRRIEKSDEETHLTEVRQKFPIIEQQLNEALVQPIEQRFFKKLLEMREDTDSQETLSFKHGLLARFLLSCLLEADRLNTADFELPRNETLRNYGKYHPWEVLIERLEQKYEDLARATNEMAPGRAMVVNQLRAQVAQACLDFAVKPKGIFQLTVPTGGGKTLASLRFALHHAMAHKMDRIFYIVPYLTIIDQNAKDVREALNDVGENGQPLDEVVLEHHSNFVSSDDTRHRHNILAENWDAPIVFTTQVQFLEALFGSGTRDARRMHQLANAIIILDEVQTIPIKIIDMFVTALRFLTHDCGSTVVLCTATQPPFDRTGKPYRALTIKPEQKIIKNDQELFEKLKRVEVHDERKPGGWSVVEVADLVDRALQESGSVLIVVNTKNSARRLYQTIESRKVNATYHLSTNMCPVHRLKILNEVKGKLAINEPVICVSTQLIEAGVDIDFGAVIRYLAGLDSITQSAGRCNRHGKREELGSVWVVNPQEEKLDRLPDIKAGREKAQTVLDDYKDSPDRFGRDRIGLNAIADYYRYYYQVKKNEMSYPVKSNSQIGREDNLYNLLSLNEISTDAYRRTNQATPDILLRQSFQSAAKSFQVIDSVTRGVVVPYEEGETIIADLCGAYELEKQYKLLKRAQRYSVNLYAHEFDKLFKIGAIKEVQPGAGIYHLDEQFYNDEFGWSDESVGDMKVLIAD